MGRRVVVAGASGRFILLLGIIAHLDVLIAVVALFLVEFLLIFVTLIFDVLRLGIRDIFLLFFLGGRALGSLHLLIFGLRLQLVELLEEGCFKLCFLCTVGGTVISLLVGFGLIWRVFSGGRFLRVPRR